MPVDDSSNVTFFNLPAGTYVAALPANAFKQGQGFPIIQEYASAEPSVVMHFYGGDQDHSLAVFTVEAVH